MRGFLVAALAFAALIAPQGASAQEPLPAYDSGVPFLGDERPQDRPAGESETIVVVGIRNTSLTGKDFGNDGGTRSTYENGFGDQQYIYITPLWEGRNGVGVDVQMAETGSGIGAYRAAPNRDGRSFRLVCRTPFLRCLQW